MVAEYPIAIHFVPEDTGEGYWFAYLPDFGWSACSATGETMGAALAQLRNVQQEVMAHFKETAKDMPKPSPPPFADEDDDAGHLRDHQEMYDGELFDADPNCDHDVKAHWNGVKCTKCTGWFCY